MQFATYALFAAAIGTLTLAAPTTEPKTFHVGFSVGTPRNLVTNLAAPRLVPADDQPGEQFVFEARALSEGPGLPASLVGAGEFKDLVFDTTSIFGEGSVVAVVQPVGSTPGAVHRVVAYEHNGSDPEWTAGHEQITHEKQAAGNSFFLCEDTIGGREASVLSFGNPTADGKAPEGCQATTLYKN